MHVYRLKLTLTWSRHNPGASSLIERPTIATIHRLPWVLLLHTIAMTTYYTESGQLRSFESRTMAWQSGFVPVDLPSCGLDGTKCRISNLNTFIPHIIILTNALLCGAFCNTSWLQSSLALSMLTFRGGPCPLSFWELQNLSNLDPCRYEPES